MPFSFWDFPQTAHPLMWCDVNVECGVWCNVLSVICDVRSVVFDADVKWNDLMQTWCTLFASLSSLSPLGMGLAHHRFLFWCCFVFTSLSTCLLRSFSSKTSSTLVHSNKNAFPQHVPPTTLHSPPALLPARSPWTMKGAFHAKSMWSQSNSQTYCEEGHAIRHAVCEEKCPPCLKHFACHQRNACDEICFNALSVLSVLSVRFALCFVPCEVLRCVVVMSCVIVKQFCACLSNRHLARDCEKKDKERIQEALCLQNSARTLELLLTAATLPGNAPPCAGVSGLKKLPRLQSRREPRGTTSLPGLAWTCTRSRIIARDLQSFKSLNNHPHLSSGQIRRVHRCCYGVASHLEHVWQTIAWSQLYAFFLHLFRCPDGLCVVRLCSWGEILTTGIATALAIRMCMAMCSHVYSSHCGASATFTYIWELREISHNGSPQDTFTKGSTKSCKRGVTAGNLYLAQPSLCIYMLTVQHKHNLLCAEAIDLTQLAFQ